MSKKQMSKAVRALIETVKQVEWVEYTEDPDAFSRECPWCHGLDWVGHKDFCDLQETLRLVKEEFGE